MLNILWPFFIIISFIFSIILGNIEEFNEAIYNSGMQAIELTIKLLGIMCIWNGLMKILQETSLINKLTKLIRPLMKILFPKIKKEDKEYKEITINLIANFLGIGNAATPLGIKAMKTMQEKNKNKEKITNDMGMFIFLNTLSLQIIPTTIIAIRASLKSQNPSYVIIPIWISTIIADTIGIIVSKILMKKI